MESRSWYETNDLMKRLLREHILATEQPPAATVRERHERFPGVNRQERRANAAMERRDRKALPA